jgi:hypothetical protein
MSKTTITIEDTLPDRLKAVIGEVKDELLRYLEDSEPNTLPDLHGDLDYSGGFHEIVDSSVPIYTSEIKDAWYLHGSELEEAYENAGVGDNPRENDGMAAIYFWLSEKASEWYHENAQDIFEEWQEKHRAKKLAGIEIFEVTAEQFLAAESGTWQADLLAAAVKEALTGDYDQAEVDPATEEEAKGLAGFYWWSCQPGCLPDGEANGPFETREEAEEDVLSN